MEVWSIVLGGRGVGLRAALEPLEPVVISFSDKEDEPGVRLVSVEWWGSVCVCVGGSILKP